MQVRCFLRLIASTNFFLLLNEQNSSTVFGELRDCAQVQASKASTRSGVLSSASAIDPGAGPMALPVLWILRRSRSSSHRSQKPVGRRQ